MNGSEWMNEWMNEKTKYQRGARQKAAKKTWTKEQKLLKELLLIGMCYADNPKISSCKELGFLIRDHS